MIAAMAKRQPGPGRPSKGDRTLMATRLPNPDSDRVREIAAAYDWSYSETLAALVAIALNHCAELPALDQQEELPLSKAS